MRGMLDLCIFLALRLFYGAVGIEAFMIKFYKAADDHVAATSFVPAHRVAAAFLNQMLGVVDVKKFAHRRLFIFIFGGEDSFLSIKEENIAKTWLAMLAKHMWLASASFKPRLLWFLSVGLAYGDSDFQQLALNDVALSKKKKNKSPVDELDTETLA